MTDLSSKARALVAAGRAGYRPSPVDRERVAAALRTHLGPAELPAQPSPQIAAPPRSLATTIGSKGLWGFAVGLGLVGGALFFALRPNPTVTQPTIASAQAVSSTAPAASAPSSDPDSTNALPIASSSALPVTSALPAVSSTRTDGLAQEVALLSRATSALRAGRAAEALSLLNEHQRKFEKGPLSEGRRAAKAQALCSLGRQTEGRAELARLAPKSPAAVRAQQACGSANPG